MKRELGIARCGLACCLCARNEDCPGCNVNDGKKDWCVNRRCSLERGIAGCYACADRQCRKGMLSKNKPYGFTQFARRYGVQELMDCLEQNEMRGIVYHRAGIAGDYDAFADAEALCAALSAGKRR